MKKYDFLKPAFIAIILLLISSACDNFEPMRLFPGDQPAASAVVPIPTITLALPAPEPSSEGGEGLSSVCALPVCASGEVYDCPGGDCPSGCGMVCVPAALGDTALPPAPADWESLEPWLAAMWRNNTNPAAVRAALHQAGWQKSLDDWRAADFDGDLRDEWVLALYDPSMPSVGIRDRSAEDLWIVNGNGAIFRYYVVPEADGYGLIGPQIVDLADMTGDGLPELIAYDSSCGANTCYDLYRIIGLVDGQFVDRLSTHEPSGENTFASSISISFSTASFDDMNSDGLPDLLIHGGMLGSVGSGIVRAHTEVWSWDGTAISLAQTILDPTDYRHHILYEANDLMAAGDLDGALALYEATINDPNLRNDDFYLYTPEQIYADISAFAAFRLILIDLLQANSERANARLSWLEMTYPDSAAAGAAAMLVNGWSGPESAEALCASIEAALLLVENPTGTLVNMGYGNPSLSAADFCPAFSSG